MGPMMKQQIQTHRCAPFFSRRDGDESSLAHVSSGTMLADGDAICTQRYEGRDER
jgi:hypothetical protein